MIIISSLVLVVIFVTLVLITRIFVHPAAAQASFEINVVVEIPVVTTIHVRILILVAVRTLVLTAIRISVLVAVTVILIRLMVPAFSVLVLIIHSVI